MAVVNSRRCLSRTHRGGTVHRNVGRGSSTSGIGQNGFHCLNHVVGFGCFFSGVDQHKCRTCCVGAGEVGTVVVTRYNGERSSVKRAKYLFLVGGTVFHGHDNVASKTKPGNVSPS